MESKMKVAFLSSEQTGRWVDCSIEWMCKCVNRKVISVKPYILWQNILDTQVTVSYTANSEKRVLINQYKIKVNGWQVKQMKTKWGSCNREKKRVWINLELAKKPERCLEYIIVHEMIHFLERHHKDTFLYYMDTYLPTWKKLKTELNKFPASHADWNY